MAGKSWLMWFAFLVFLIYTPVLKGVDVGVLNIPSLLVFWFLMTAICLLSVILFAVNTWREWD